MTQFHWRSDQQNQTDKSQQKNLQNINSESESIDSFQKIIARIQTLQSSDSVVGTLKDYPLDQLLVDAQAIGQALRKTNLEEEQVRKFLHLINQLKVKLLENDFSTIEVELVLLKPKLAYIASHNDAIKPLSQFVVAAIDKVHSIEDFNCLTHLIEQITGSDSSLKTTDELESSASSAIDVETLTWLAADSWDILPPYEWDEQGAPQGKPVCYVPGVGLVVEGGKEFV